MSNTDPTKQTYSYSTAYKFPHYIQTNKYNTQFMQDKLNTFLW